MSVQGAQGGALEKANGYLISNRLLKAGDKLVLPGACGFCGHVPVDVSIADWSGRVVFAQNYAEGFPISIAAKNLKEGYYTATVQMRARRVQDEFYIGDPERIINSMERRQETSSPLSQEHLQRDPMIRRYKILMAAQYYHPLEAGWQRKVLLVLRDAEWEEREPEHALWTKHAGMHLREYISRIDDTPQFYLLNVPSNNRGPMPLVIEMPYVHTPQRPFLESSLPIGWPTVLDILKRAAGNSGAMVAVIYGRGNVGDEPIGEADVFEALNDIVANYSIDVRKIYLYGTCEGGRRALLLAEHYSNVFAAVGAYGPKLDEDVGGSAWNWSGRPGNVITHMDRLAGTPVSIFQGEFDDTVPIGDLQSFSKVLKRISPSSQLHIVPDGLHGYNESEVALFPWFVRIGNQLASPPIAKSAKEALSKVVTRQSAP